MSVRTDTFGGKMMFLTDTSRVFLTENFGLTSASMPSWVRKTAEFGKINAFPLIYGPKRLHLQQIMII